MVRNAKISKAILLPSMVLLFIIGWSLTYVGSKNVGKKIKCDVKVKEHFGVEFGVMQHDGQQVCLS